MQSPTSSFTSFTPNECSTLAVPKVCWLRPSLPTALTRSVSISQSMRSMKHQKQFNTDSRSGP